MKTNKLNGLLEIIEIQDKMDYFSLNEIKGGLSSGISGCCLYNTGCNSNSGTQPTK